MAFSNMLFSRSRGKNLDSHAIADWGCSLCYFTYQNVFQRMVCSICHSLHILPLTAFVMRSKKLSPAGPIILNNGLFYMSRLLNQPHSQFPTRNEKSTLNLPDEWNSRIPIESCTFRFRNVSMYYNVKKDNEIKKKGCFRLSSEIWLSSRRETSDSCSMHFSNFDT